MAALAARCFAGSLAAAPGEMAVQMGYATRTPNGAVLEWEEPMFADEDSMFEGRFPDALRAAMGT